MDAVAIVSILGVVLSIVIILFLAFKVGHLIKHTHSQD